MRASLRAQESAVREKLLLEMKRELKKMQASGTFGAAAHGQQLTTHDLPTCSATFIRSFSL
jgi:hypothetical protein